MTQSQSVGPSQITAVHRRAEWRPRCESCGRGGGAEQPVALGVKSNTVHPRREARQFQHFLAGSKVPNADRLVDARGRQPPPVRTERTVRYVERMPLERHLAAGLGVHNPHFASKIGMSAKPAPADGADRLDSASWLPERRCRKLCH
jgi:hypothetical protein